MSWKASGWAKGVSGISRSEKLLLLILADYYNDEAKAAWPSISTLATEALMSERHVQRLLDSLAAKGVIQISRGGGRGHSSRYELKGDMVSPFVAKRVTSRHTKGDIAMSPEPIEEPTMMMMTPEREKYDGILKATGTLSGIHAPEKYWARAKQDHPYDPEDVTEAVQWISKAMGIRVPMTLPTPSYLPALSRFGRYVAQGKVRPNDMAIVNVVEDRDRVSERLLYGVARQVGAVIGELR